MSMCDNPLRELSNPGASGSIFYLTNDDEFIIKTVQHKEGEFLQKLLAGNVYYIVCSFSTFVTGMFFYRLLYEFKSKSKNLASKVLWTLLLSM